MLNIVQKSNSTAKSFLKFIKNIKTKKLVVTMLSNPINGAKHQCLWTLVDTLRPRISLIYLKYSSYVFHLTLFLS